MLPIKASIKMHNLLFKLFIYILKCGDICKMGQLWLLLNWTAAARYMYNFKSKCSNTQKAYKYWICELCILSTINYLINSVTRNRLFLSFFNSVFNRICIFNFHTQTMHLFFSPPHHKFKINNREICTIIPTGKL